MIPKRITVHCSASKKGRYLTAAEIKKFHTDPKPKGRGWRDIGYHFVIRTDGVVEGGRPLTMQGAHVAGHNKDNIGICLVGGLDSNGNPCNTFSSEQFHALYALLIQLCEEHDILFGDICGHRDFSPDLNGDGEITSDEYIKECPCFNVREWFKAKLDSNEVKHGLV